MRIFYASDTTPNASFHSNIWRNNLYLSLVDLGHDVVEFQYNLRETFRHLLPQNPKHRAFIDKNRPKLERELLKQIRAAHAHKPIDLFFSYFYSACATKETIHHIRDMGIKTLNWFCNASYQFFLIDELAPAYDWCLAPEKYRLDDYRRIGANPIHCQQAANPNIYKPYDLPVEFDVTFVGQAYGDRPAYIKYLLDQGIDVRVWGYGWKNTSHEACHNPFRRALHIGKKLLSSDGWQAIRQRFQETFSTQVNAGEPGSRWKNIITELPDYILGRLLSDIDVIKMYSRSKINLGFSTCGNTHETGERIVQIRLRDFEVPMSGGFYIVEYMEELEEFYDVGKEIVCYNGPEDLADKIKYYLSHDVEREAIRKAGYERCLRDHTWHKRFERVFQEIGTLTLDDGTDA